MRTEDREQQTGALGFTCEGVKWVTASARRAGPPASQKTVCGGGGAEASSGAA